MYLFFSFPTSNHYFFKQHSQNQSTFYAVILLENFQFSNPIIIPFSVWPLYRRTLSLISLIHPLYPSQLTKPCIQHYTYFSYTQQAHTVIHTQIPNHRYFFSILTIVSLPYIKSGRIRSSCSISAHSSRKLLVFTRNLMSPLSYKILHHL